MSKHIKTEQAKRKLGRPVGSGNFSKEQMEADVQRMEPVMERVRAAVEHPVPPGEVRGGRRTAAAQLAGHR